VHPRDYTGWAQVLRAARTRAALRMLERRLLRLPPDAEVLRLRQLCGQRRRALAVRPGARAPGRAR